MSAFSSVSSAWADASFLKLNSPFISIAHHKRTSNKIHHSVHSAVIVAVAVVFIRMSIIITIIVNRSITIGGISGIFPITVRNLLKLALSFPLVRRQPKHRQAYRMSFYVAQEAALSWTAKAFKLSHIASTASAAQASVISAHTYLSTAIRRIVQSALVKACLSPQNRTSRTPCAVPPGAATAASSAACCANGMEQPSL